MSNRRPKSSLMGEAAGKAVASWAYDGNTPIKWFQKVLFAAEKTP